MTQSGTQARPARILLVALGVNLERILRVLRAEGYIVEVTSGAHGASERLEHAPPIDVLVIDGISGFERERVLTSARERNVWCVYLRTQDGADLPAAQRDQLVAAIAIDADEARIAGTIRTAIAARRSKTAS